MTSEPFAVVILAAGQGTRMKSARPKVLHPLAGRPMIRHLLATVAELAPERMLVVVAPGMDEVAEAVAPVPSVVQAEQRGTADAVKAARRALEGQTGTVLILYGDTPLLGRETLTRVLALRRSASAPAVVVLGFRPAEPGAYGRLVLGAGGELEAIIEAPESSAADRANPLCNSGVMAVESRRLFPWLDRAPLHDKKREFYLTDLVTIARADGARAAMIEGPAGELMGINTRADLAAAEATVQAELRARALGGGVTLIDPSSVWFSHDTVLAADVTVHPHVVFGPGVRVAEGAVIHSFSHLDGAEIGPGAVVGPFARLRPGAVLAARAHVGNFVEVKKTRLGEGAKANHLTYLGDAEIGAGANIGGGTITCNYDGFSKHETRIGAGAFIGSLSALVAPVTIGAGAIVGAGSTITHDVPDDALAVARAHQIVREGYAQSFRRRKGGAAKKAKKA